MNSVVYGWRSIVVYFTGNDTMWQFKAIIMYQINCIRVKVRANLKGSTLLQFIIYDKQPYVIWVEKKIITQLFMSDLLFVNLK